MNYRLHSHHFVRLSIDVASKVEARRYDGRIFSCLFSTIKSEGITGLYQGFTMALFGIIVFKGLHLGGYDILKAVLDIDTDFNSNEPRHIRTNLVLYHRILAAQVILR